MRSGIDLLFDLPGAGNPVRRHEWYQIRLSMWLHRGDAVRWQSGWGTDPAKLEDDGAVLVTHVRFDRENLIAGLFYGCEGMNVGGKRRLRIAPGAAGGPVAARARRFTVHMLSGAEHRSSMDRNVRQRSKRPCSASSSS